MKNRKHNIKICVAIFLLSSVLLSGCLPREEKTSGESSVSASGSEISVEISSEATVESSEDISYESSIESAPSEESSISEDSSQPDDNSQPENDSDTVYDCKLIVKGVDITEGSGVKMYNDRAELPFVAIMEELGVDFEWESNTAARMYYGVNSPMSLDIKNGELQWANGSSEINHFSEYSDSSLKYTPMEKEILIDDVNFAALLSELDMYFRIYDFDIDYEDKVIRIGKGLKEYEYYECTLIVNGKDITEDSHAVMENGNGIYVRLPFVAIMEELGAEFEWESNRYAKMHFQEMTLYLDIDEGVLWEIINDDFRVNLFAVVGGGPLEHTAMDKELLLDSVCARSFFREVGITLDINYDERVVTIVSSPNPPFSDD